MIDLLIRGAWVIDGTGNPGFKASLGVDKGRIAFIDRSNSTVEASKVIEANGLVLTPGFIDVHTHSDYTIFVHNHATSTLLAGVTTEAMGMCGYGVFPLNEWTITEALSRMAGKSQVAKSEIGEADWTDLDGWLSKLDRRKIGINAAHFAGHGALRSYSLGKEAYSLLELSPDRLEKVKRVLRETLEQGAFGMTSGLSYSPGANALPEELTELCKVVHEFGGAYISHVRCEGDNLVASIKEFIQTCKMSGVRGSATHHKAVVEENWGKVRATTAFIEEARNEGVDIICDLYPWTLTAQSNIGSSFYTDYEISPRDADELKARLSDPHEWKSLKETLKAKKAQGQKAARALVENLGKYGVKCSQGMYGPGNNFIVRSKNHPELVGLTLMEAAERLGLGDDHLEAARMLYLNDDGYCHVAGGMMWEEDIRYLLALPYMAISTDSWTMAAAPDARRPGSFPHPRNQGTYALVLGRYVREEKLLSLEDAVRKMTSLPASLLGLDSRGLLSPGYHADLCLFDRDRIKNLSTHDNPLTPPAGIEYVIVNGTIAVDRGKRTDSLSGQVLRRA